MCVVFVLDFPIFVSSKRRPRRVIGALAAPLQDVQLPAEAEGPGDAQQPKQRPIQGLKIELRYVRHIWCFLDVFFDHFKSF